MKLKPREKFMLLAIKEARKNIYSMEGGPFGACIVKGQRVVALARNKVLASDATSHAEVNAIRAASLALKSFDLSGCVIYSTTEPCPMCFSAIHWAKIDAVIYGTDIKDAKRIGFNELGISCRKMKVSGKSGVKIFSRFLYPQCLVLMQRWAGCKNKMLY